MNTLAYIAYRPATAPSFRQALQTHPKAAIAARSQARHDKGVERGAVARGEMPLSPAVAARVREIAFGSPEGEQSPPARLTAREREALTLMAQGLSNAEMAEVLEITERTVKFHVGNIYRKLGVRSRAEAILVAVREGEENRRGYPD